MIFAAQKKCIQCFMVAEGTTQLGNAHMFQVASMGVAVHKLGIYIGR